MRNMALSIGRAGRYPGGGALLGMLTLVASDFALAQNPVAPPSRSPVPLAVQAGDSIPTSHAAPPGGRMGFVVTYFYYAMYQGADACPSGTNPMVTTKAFLAKLPDAERARLILPENKRELYRKTVERGPKGENLCLTPWAVNDTSLLTLAGDVNDGLNLDGWNGMGKPPKGVCAQKQYVTEDRKTDGVDNQLGRVYACINGYRQKGTLEPYFTQAMRDGMWSMLIDVSDVQDSRNDKSVVVDIYAGAENMVKDGTGKILAGASLSPLTTPRYHRQLRGKIVDGMLETMPVENLVMPDLMSKTQPDTTLLQPRFKLTLLPDGTATGLLGGYRSVDTLFTPNADAGEGEGYLGFRCEALYNALHRYADGGRDPKTGDCSTISVAYKVEAIPAFIVHPSKKDVPSFADAH